MMKKVMVLMSVLFALSICKADERKWEEVSCIICEARCYREVSLTNMAAWTGSSGLYLVTGNSYRSDEEDNESRFITCSSRLEVCQDCLSKYSSEYSKKVNALTVKWLKEKQIESAKLIKENRRITHNKRLQELQKELAAMRDYLKKKTEEINKTLIELKKEGE